MIGMVKKRINDLEIEKAELERQIDTRATLRDQFAMAALSGLIAISPAPKSLDGIAEFSYLAADSMMEARKLKGD
jgi:hypothetical protein